MEKLNCSVYEVSDTLEELIADGAVIPVYVSGSSMNPFLISRRDVVYLRKLNEYEIKKGKILLFKREDGSLVLHRVKKILADSALLMIGDAQSETEKISKTQIVATVSEIERKGKRRSAESFYWNSINAIWRILSPFRPFIMRVWFKIRRMRRKHGV